jgi:preprotein translocase subunit SecY
MASAAEQLAANLNFGAFSKATELKKRIWFTRCAVSSTGSAPISLLPGINLEALQQAFQQQSTGILCMVQYVRRRRRGAHGDLALGIMPYISHPSSYS